jgi:hypothetical protein
MTVKTGINTVLDEIKRVIGNNGTCVVSFKTRDEKSSSNGIQVRERWGEKIRYYFVDFDMCEIIIKSHQLNIIKVERSRFRKTEFVNFYLTE